MNDHYHRLSESLGYRSRAAFKLRQIVAKFDVIENGDVVVDLGCYPGGWLQVAISKVGEDGFVYGVDLRTVKQISAPNVTTAHLDVEDERSASLILNALPRKADVVLSDLAPGMSGVYHVDHFRQMALARAALRIATAVLRPGGNCVLKVFEGDMLRGFESDVSRTFASYKRFKPNASRKRSSELYLICFSFKSPNLP